MHRGQTPRLPRPRSAGGRAATSGNGAAADSRVIRVVGQWARVLLLAVGGELALSGGSRCLPVHPPFFCRSRCLHSLRRRHGEPRRRWGGGGGGHDGRSTRTFRTTGVPGAGAATSFPMRPGGRDGCGLVRR